MNEAEWLGCEEPRLMLELLEDKMSDRKLRLFICACCRQIWHLMTEKSWQQAVEMAEQYAGGVGKEQQMAQLRDAIWCAEFRRGLHLLPPHQPPDAAQLALSARPFFPACNVPKILKAVTGESAVSVALLHDIFGNPFRSVTFSAAWRTSTAVALAAQMYDSREFSAMPILADALQDAGCDNDDVLNHCRDPKQTHVRGSWVVDFVLDRG